MDNDLKCLLCENADCQNNAYGLCFNLVVMSDNAVDGVCSCDEPIYEYIEK